MEQNKSHLRTKMSARPVYGLRALLCGGSALVMMSMPALAAEVDTNALPSGAQIRAGAASFDYGTAGELHVHQSTDRVFIDWNNFNIGRDALTEFHQNDSSALAVNRVVSGGSDPTQILGALKSNGRVIVLDQNGVIFGRESTIDVGGIIAAPGNIDIDKAITDSRIRARKISTALCWKNTNANIGSQNWPMCFTILMPKPLSFINSSVRLSRTTKSVFFFSGSLAIA
jgi:filamentous hemagglutinin family protein